MSISSCGMRFFVLEQQRTDEVATAGSKARDDMDRILQERECLTPLVVTTNRWRRGKLNPLTKLLGHVAARLAWDRSLKAVSEGDVVVVQFPPRNHSLLLKGAFARVRRRGARFIYMVHDLNCLRYVHHLSRHRAGRHVREELDLLPMASGIVAHNAHMADILASQCNVRRESIVELGVFDYLVDDDDQWATVGRNLPVVIAGNLRQSKAGYVYQLRGDVDVRLYGPNLVREALPDHGIEYMGSFDSSELVGVLAGSYGLVWDGSSTNTCSGAFGEYLRINNPHKTSLYLASGMPVIVWNDSAMADFVRAEGVGIAVASLDGLGAALEAVGDEEYELMCRRAREIGASLREGHYTHRALCKSMGSERCM